MALGKLDNSVQKSEIRSFLTPHTKFSSKWTNILNVRSKILKLEEENIRENPHDICPGKKFFEYELKNIGNTSKNRWIGLY